jgi:hypothetical protein
MTANQERVIQFSLITGFLFIIIVICYAAYQSAN